MDVIGILAQKGGVGKTHLGTNWAVEAERTGVEGVAVLDLDPQGTAASWSQQTPQITRRGILPSC